LIILVFWTLTQVGVVIIELLGIVLAIWSKRVLSFFIERRLSV
jgi:hypothetical protein